MFGKYTQLAPESHDGKGRLFVYPFPFCYSVHFSGAMLLAVKHFRRRCPQQLGQVGSFPQNWGFPAFHLSSGDCGCIFLTTRPPVSVKNLRRISVTGADQISESKPLKKNLGLFRYTYLDPPRGAKWMLKGATKQPLRVETPPLGGCW